MRGVRGSTAACGTVARYRAGCDCPACRAAIRRYETCRRIDTAAGITRTVPVVGTIRRLQALAAIGWPGHEIAARLGCDRTRVAQVWRADPAGVALRTTAEAVARVYADLCMIPGPSATHSRRRAVREGWAPPLAWDDIDDPAATANLGATTDTGVDPVAIERAIAGDAITLTHAERVEAVRITAARGNSDAEIAQRLRVTARTVQRIRTEHNILSRWNEAA